MGPESGGRFRALEAWGEHQMESLTQLYCLI